MKKVRSSIRVAAMADLAVRIAKSFRQEHPIEGDVTLEQMIVKAENTSASLITAINQDIASSTLDMNDSRRDSCLRAVYSLDKAYLSMDSYRENAALLDAVLGKYGRKITEAAYSEESALIESLLEDISVQELQPVLAALPSVNEAVTELRNAQTEFNKARVAYQAAIAGKSVKESAIELKKVLLGHFNRALIPYVSAMVTINQAEYAAFAKTMEEMINETNSLVESRAAKEKEDEKDAGIVFKETAEG